jgi:predicted nucleic acid-binding protein
MPAHERMTEMKMRLLGDRVPRRTAWQIARQHDWDTLRDAEYLAVTRLQADALVTVDARLAAIARDLVAVAAVDDLLAPG